MSASKAKWRQKKQLLEINYRNALAQLEQMKQQKAFAISADESKEANREAQKLINDENDFMIDYSKLRENSFAR